MPSFLGLKLVVTLTFPHTSLQNPLAPASTANVGNLSFSTPAWSNAFLLLRHIKAVWSIKPLILSSGCAELAKDNFKLGHLLTALSGHLGTSHFKKGLLQQGGHLGILCFQPVVPRLLRGGTGMAQSKETANKVQVSRIPEFILCQMKIIYVQAEIHPT